MKAPLKVKDRQPPRDRMRSRSDLAAAQSDAGKSETTSERLLREYVTEV